MTKNTYTEDNLWLYRSLVMFFYASIYALRYPVSYLHNYLSNDCYKNDFCKAVMNQFKHSLEISDQEVAAFAIMALSSIVIKDGTKVLLPVYHGFCAYWNKPAAKEQDTLRTPGLD